MPKDLCSVGFHDISDERENQNRYQALLDGEISSSLYTKPNPISMALSQVHSNFLITLDFFYGGLVSVKVANSRPTLLQNRS